MSKRRVVVTGLGMVSPLGNSVAESWQQILEGRSGVAEINSFDTSAYATRIGASIKDFSVDEYMSAKEAKRFDPFIHYGIAAAEQALSDSGLAIQDDNAHRVGTAIGSGIGGIGLIEKSRMTIEESG